MVTIETPKCWHCGNTGTIELTEAEAVALKVTRFVQDALPMRTADEREQVMTGTHPACWAEMFPNEDEEDEEDDWWGEDQEVRPF